MSASGANSRGKEWLDAPGRAGVTVDSDLRQGDEQGNQQRAGQHRP